MAGILTNIGLVFTEAIGWVGDVASTITNTPILMVFAAVPLCGLGIGMFKRLINVN